ncbi:MAG: ribosome biogenesis GTPase YlqF, partial [Clostridiales bacterium]|nr:ribosome biogenesis GTPase YlqF [Clostridiales bacterium]
KSNNNEKLTKVGINWYPGHMAKAKRMLEEDLKLIDVVVEIVDARAPSACRNPDFEALFKNKIRVMLLNKSDLSDKSANREWIEHFRRQGISVMEYVSVNSSARKNAVSLIEKAGEPVLKKYRDKGVSKTLRAMVVGIPNVGKSTFINKLAGINKALTGDKPGVTRGKQWVKISPYLELMDTPGLLWAKLDDQILARHLAYLGSIRDDIMNVEEIAGALLKDLALLSHDALYSRFKKLPDNETAAPEEMLEGVARSRGFILQGGVYDLERAARIVLDEYRAGKIAKVTFELPDNE